MRYQERMGKILQFKKRDGIKNPRGFVDKETVGIWMKEIDRAIAQLKESTFGRYPLDPGLSSEAVSFLSPGPSFEPGNLDYPQPD